MELIKIFLKPKIKSPNIYDTLDITIYHYHNEDITYIGWNHAYCVEKYSSLRYIIILS